MQQNIRILVVEDNLVLLSQYSSILETAGYEVLEANTGAAALGIFNERHPQMVLLDVNLSDMDGREVCQFIKQDQYGPQTSVLLISGEMTSGADKASGWNKGADDFLVKPVGALELVSRVRSLLRLRQTTEALRASEQYYRRLVEILPDAVLLVNLQGRLLSANPRGLTLLGYSSETELAKTSFIELVHSTQQERFSALLGETLAAQVMRDQEFLLIRRDGQELPVEISTASLDTFRGHALTVVLVVRDISFRKSAEADLVKGKSLQKALLENIPEPAWWKDGQGRFLACNKALASFYGKTPEQLIGGTVFDLPISREMADQLQQEDLKVMRTRTTGRSEGERTNVKGERRWLQSITAPVLSPNGDCLGVVGIAHDTTERRRLVEELRLQSRRIIQAQEAERLRVARDLHDSVNQLLASVQMRIRRIEGALSHERPSTREILARCHEQIIAALEENRRIAHGLRPSDLDELGLAVSSRNFCRQFRSRTNLKLDFTVRGFEARPPRDVELNLFRILQEALGNVEKHARATQIRLSLTCSRGVVRLKVRDNGHGFDPKTRNHPRRTKGGAGLSNMKERAAYLGGTCEILSTPGQGTTVRVRIPPQAEETHPVI